MFHAFDERLIRVVLNRWYDAQTAKAIVEGDTLEGWLSRHLGAYQRTMTARQNQEAGLQEIRLKAEKESSPLIEARKHTQGNCDHPVVTDFKCEVCGFYRPLLEATKRSGV